MKKLVYVFAVVLIGATTALLSACRREQPVTIQGSWVLTDARQNPGNVDLFANQVYRTCERNATMHTFGRNNQYSHTDGCTRQTTTGSYFYNAQQQTLSITRQNNPNMPELYRVASLTGNSLRLEIEVTGGNTHTLSYRRQ